MAYMTLLAESYHVENSFIVIRNNKGADQLADTHSLISNFIVSCLEIIVSQVYITEKSHKFGSCFSVAVQAGICFTRYKTPKTGFLATRLIVLFL